MKEIFLMNLIVSAHPKGSKESVSGALAERLAAHLGGQTLMARLYQFPQQYYNYKPNEKWIALVKKADHLIFPIPMWNFSIPAALKDFIDKIAKEGETWRMEKGGRFIGLLTDRPAYIIMTAGGHYPQGSPDDFVVPYLKRILAFMGIANVQDFRVSSVSNSKKLISDKTYLDDKTRQMLAAFHLD